MADVTTLVDLLQSQAQKNPGKVIFTYSYNGDEQDRRQLTFRELDQHAQAVAAALQQQGAAGKRVLAIVKPGLEFIVGFFGCVYAGAVAIPVHQRLAPRLAAVVPDARASRILTTADNEEALKASVAHLVDGAALHWTILDHAISADPASWIKPTIDPDAPVVIQYTSGSTLAPKGVVLTHRNLLHNLAGMQQALDLGEGDSSVYWLPPHHDMGLIGAILLPMYVGYTAHLMSPAAFIKRPMRWLEAISRYRATGGSAPNFAFDRCVETSTPEDRAALDLSCLTEILNGGEPVRASTLSAFTEAFAPVGFRRELFTPVYGLAEATLMVSGEVRTGDPRIRYIDRNALGEDHIRDVAADDPAAMPVVGCGRPQPGQDVRIVDPVTRRPCGPDEIGEIWIAGLSVARSYWQRPEETEQSLRSHLVGQDGRDGEGPFLRTGDLGFLYAGELYPTGRVKDLVVIDGHHYYPNDVEVTVQACHPGLATGRGAVFTVVPVDDSGRGMEHMAIVQEVDRSRIDEADYAGVIRAIRAAVLRHHGIEPVGVVLVEPVSIPTTSSGKIQRQQCRRQFIERKLAVVYGWHRMPNELPRPDPEAIGPGGFDDR